MNYRDLIFIEHILDTIKDIEASTNKISKEEFQNSKDITDACVRRLEVIGEAVKNISKETRDQHPEIEWKKIAGTRDVIIHCYFSVDLDIVWDIIKKDIAVLKGQIEKLKEEGEL